MLALIPARQGSKRLPGKNVLPLAGRPLIAHTIGHALFSSTVNRVVVSTDGDEIAEVSARYGAEVIRRPAEMATDEASSLPALKHALEWLERSDGYVPDAVVFLQCTSPVRRAGDIDGAVRAFASGDADCVFSACRFKDYIWRVEKGGVDSVNFDYRNEWWRGQDFPLQYRSNGSIFVYRTEELKKAGSIFFGKLAIYEMDYLSSFQVDTPEDFDLCRSILELTAMKGSLSW
ncbi:MAG: acylneuraminate cytidylyltransferase family protein [Nitrospirota bacterium]